LSVCCQAIGVAISLAGLLMVGPSTILGSDAQTSTGLFFGGLMIAAIGHGTAFSVQPYVLLRILWVEARLSKKDLAGALMAINMLGLQVAALIGTPVAAIVYNGSGERTVSTYLFVTVLAICVPSIAFVARFMEAPQRPLGAGRDDRGRQEALVGAPAPVATPF
jgi:hypothetical protein